MLRNLGKKEKMELTITGIGVVFLLFLVMGNVQKIKNKKLSMMETSKSVESSLSAPISFKMPEIDESTLKEDWGRDPFSLGVSSMVSAGFEGLILNGIVWDKENPYAIINNDIVKVGDDVGGATVIEINKQNVVLEYEGETHTINLPVTF